MNRRWFYFLPQRQCRVAHIWITDYNCFESYYELISLGDSFFLFSPIFPYFHFFIHDLFLAFFFFCYPLYIAETPTTSRYRYKIGIQLKNQGQRNRKKGKQKQKQKTGREKQNICDTKLHRFFIFMYEKGAIPLRFRLYNDHLKKESIHCPAF